MFAFTTIIRQPSGDFRVEDGTLYRLPPELIDPPRVRRYGAIKAPGWGISEYGYSYFAKLNCDGELLIFPGLIIEGAGRPTKKFSGYTTTFNRDQIEKYMDSLVLGCDELKARAQADLSMLIHDLRRLSSIIYNAGVEALSRLDAREWYEASERIKNVIAAQTILKIRTDALDFEGTAPTEIEPRDVPIFRRVDKVNKCMKPSAAEKRITTHLQGESRGSSRGPDVFEIVPYVLLDNAIKYSEPDGQIRVEVNETGQTIRLSVFSNGPEITEYERNRIFERGFRGGGAIKSGRAGSGLGLFLAERIVRVCFGGKIGVIQQATSSQVLTHVPTEFWVELPTC